MTNEQLIPHLGELNKNWILSSDKTTITRKISTKDFSEAMSVTQIVAALAETENHHPDIRLGWGYCHVSFTTHSTKSLSKLDFLCAQKLDTLLATSQRHQ